MIERREARTLSVNDQVLLATWAVKTVFHARASVRAPLPRAGGRSWATNHLNLSPRGSGTNRSHLPGAAFG